MRFRKTAAIGVACVACIAAGCSSSDEPAGPDPADPVPPTIEEFYLSPGGAVRHGDSARLVWDAPNAETAAIAPGLGTVSPAADGSIFIRPVQGTTYTLTVSNSVGSATATLTVDVEYRPGLYVSAASGDDANAGTTPFTALRTLDAALARIGSGGAVFLAGASNPANATYTTAIDLDGRDVSIYAGLDPSTFFGGEGEFTSTVKPSAGTPLVVRNTATRLEIFDLVLDASNGGDYAALIDGAGANFERCTFDARNSATGTAIQLENDARVSMDACRVSAGRQMIYSETAGIRASAAGDLLVTNCFINGGRATLLSSGVEARGLVRLGFNTILAEITEQGAGRSAACVRILDGNPAIGGNILMGQGNGQRLGVMEGAVGTDPSWFEGNLFISLTVPPYLNADDLSPTSELELNTDRYTTDDPFTVGGNYWNEDVAATMLFQNFATEDYHLIDPTLDGQANPAVDRGDVYLAKEEYGAVRDDIDGARRPSFGRELDLGADER
jgi:hypothetical protein